MQSTLNLKRKAAMAGIAALVCAQPVTAQDAQSAVDENGEEVMVITPDMVTRGDSRVLGGEDGPRSQPEGQTVLAPPRSSTGQSPPSVLAIFAHPDDEITIAPVLSRMARTGGEVTLVFATSGDAGPGVTTMEPGEELAALREDEAGCAAFALGLDEPIFWRLGDGTLNHVSQIDNNIRLGRKLSGRPTRFLAASLFLRLRGPSIARSAYLN